MKLPMIIVSMFSFIISTSAQVNPCLPEVDYNYRDGRHSWQFNSGQDGLAVYGISEDKAAYLQIHVGDGIWWVNCDDNPADCGKMLGDIDKGRVPSRPPSAEVPPKKKQSEASDVSRGLYTGSISFGPKSQLPMRCKKGKEVARKLQRKYMKR